MLGRPLRALPKKQWKSAPALKPGINFPGNDLSPHFAQLNATIVFHSCLNSAIDEAWIF